MSHLRSSLAAEFLLRQFREGTYTRVPWRQPDLCLIDAGYCLDAPEAIPAGSRESFEFAKGDFASLETFSSREEALT